MANTYPKTPGASTRYFTAYLADVSAPSVAYIRPGFRGKIKSISGVLGGAITGTNSTVTTKINTTAVTGGALTVVQSGSAAGDVATATPTGANTFTATDVIRLDSDGASSTTATYYFTVEVEAV